MEEFSKPGLLGRYVIYHQGKGIFAGKVARAELSSSGWVYFIERGPISDQITVNDVEYIYEVS
ncbi:MAG: hypothetical protein WAQ22_00995 [Candidatus Saccharimonas sp.]